MGACPAWLAFRVYPHCWHEIAVVGFPAPQLVHVIIVFLPSGGDTRHGFKNVFRFRYERGMTFLPLLFAVVRVRTTLVREGQLVAVH
jgi:hypothetical protein